MIDSQTAAFIRKALGGLQQQIDELRQAHGNRGPQDEIDSIPGRRIAYTLVGTQDFTTTQDNTRAGAINMQISQDGPFVMTHYPVAMWRPSLPTNATNFGKWRPVYTWPLEAQQITAAGTLTDVIDISYEIVDGGSQRNFQNLAAPPILSRPDELHRLPCPTMFAPNSTVQFFPTYNDIAFGGAVATTTGTLVVGLPGYRVVNM